MADKINLKDIHPPAFNRLTQNSLLLVLSNLGGAALSFLISILVARELGEAGFGRWVFVLVWASGLTTVCEFGLSGVLTRDAAQKPSSLNHLLFNSLLIKLFVVLVLGGALWSASPMIGLEAETSAGIHYAVLIAFAGVAYASFAAVFRASGWIAPILWINYLGLGLQGVGFVWLLGRSSGVLPLIQWMVVINGLQVAICAVLWWRWIRSAGGEIYFSLPSLLSMVRRAIPFAVAGLVGALQMRSSPLLLGYVRGEVGVGLFGSASRTSESAKLIPNGVFDAVFPALARGDSKRRREIYQRLNRLVLAYVVIVVGILVLFRNSVLRLTYGQNFLAASPVLFWLGVALIPTLYNAVAELYLYATGEEGFATRVGVVGAAVQICLGLPLMFLYGPSGAGMGILLGELAIWIPLRVRMKKIISLS